MEMGELDFNEYAYIVLKVLRVVRFTPLGDVHTFKFF